MTNDGAGLYILYDDFIYVYNDFYFLGPRGPLGIPLSVRPSVRPSVGAKNLDQLYSSINQLYDVLDHTNHIFSESS